MRTLIFRLLIGTVCVLGFIWLASCSDTVEPGGEMEAGAEVMKMSLNLQPLREAGLTVTRVHVLIQKGAFSREMDLEIDGEMATGVFEGLTPGIYEIFVNMYEGESLIATGTGEGVVVAGQTTTATIQMNLTSGNLEIIVEWGPDSRVTIVDFTPFSPAVKWIAINDRDPVGLPLLRWQYEISDIPANPTLSFDYAGAETEFTGIWLWDEFLSYLPATGGDETFQHFEINIDPSLLVVGKNYIGFVSGYIPSQGEADGVLFKNVKLGDIDFTPFAPNVDWVECNDRDPVGLPFLRWRFTLSSIPENPSLVFEYAGAETDETQFWVGESRIAYLPETGGDEEFSSYEIDIDPALLKIGSNQLGFISGYIPSQNEADGILFRDVRLIGGEK